MLPDTHNKKSAHPDQQESDDKHEKSDPGTTNSTDPQDHMEGPISSLVHKVGEGLDNKAEKKKE